MLQHINSYCGINPGEECRRLLLVNTFTLDKDSETISDKKESCDFCDGCVPDLDFKLTEAKAFEFEITETDKKDASFLEKQQLLKEKRKWLVSRLENIAKNFNFILLNALIRDIQDSRRVNDMLLECGRRLESEPDNIAYLYASGVLSVIRGSHDIGIGRIKNVYNIARANDDQNLCMNILINMHQLNHNLGHTEYAKEKEFLEHAKDKKKMYELKFTYDDMNDFINTLNNKTVDLYNRIKQLVSQTN